MEADDKQIRTLEGIEDLLDKLTYSKFDGKSKLDPPYTIDKPTDKA